MSLVLSVCIPQRRPGVVRLIIPCLGFWLQVHYSSPRAPVIRGQNSHSVSPSEDMIRECRGRDTAVGSEGSRFAIVCTSMINAQRSHSVSVMSLRLEIGDVGPTNVGPR